MPVRPDFLSDRLIDRICFVLEKCNRFETKDIYEVLLFDEFQLDEGFKYKVVLDNPNLNVENAVTLVNSKLLSVKVRTTIWKQFHNVLYNDILKAKISNTVPVCKYCTEVDVNRVHLYFSCVKNNGCGRIFMKILQVFGQFEENDVLNMNFDVEIPQLAWFIANYLHYMQNNSENCNPGHFKQFLLAEFEVVRRSKFCDGSLEIEMNNLIQISDQ